MAKYGDVLGVVAEVGFPGGTGILPVAEEELTAFFLSNERDAGSTERVASQYLRDGEFGAL
jgi:hypothetical protein